MKKYKLKILIIGNLVSLFLFDRKGIEISKSTWTDKRDLSEKILVKIDLMLTKNNLTISDIFDVDFDCDSPYFNRKEKKMLINENLSSENKCGFMAWQVGEVSAKILNFCR
ncbi:MAG: hypothetical protein KAI57_00235 [Candidatus Pacebacteria bacterium]|nr:hypothetical protein [Candidatus Paceibacterota bacterium]